MLQRIIWALISLLIAGFINKALCATGLCERIRISGTKEHIGAEGVYALKTGESCGGKAVWKNEDQNVYIYATEVDNQKYWVVGYTLCGTAVAMHGAIDEPFDSPLQVPNGGWQEYSTAVNDWVESPLSTSCEEEEQNDEPEPPNDTELCERIEISGAHFRNLGVEGIYKLKDKQGCRNKPVWKQEDYGRYIYALVVTDKLLWVVGETYCGTVHDEINLRPRNLYSYESPLDVPLWNEANDVTDKWEASSVTLTCRKKSDDSSEMIILALEIAGPVLVFLIISCVVIKKCWKPSPSRSSPEPTGTELNMTEARVTNVYAGYMGPPQGGQNVDPRYPQGIDNYGMEPSKLGQNVNPQYLQGAPNYGMGPPQAIHIY